MQNEIGTLPLAVLPTPNFQDAKAQVPERACNRSFLFPTTRAPAPFSNWGLDISWALWLKTESHFLSISYLSMSFLQNLLLRSSVIFSGKKTEPAKTLTSLFQAWLPEQKNILRQEQDMFLKKKKEKKKSSVKSDIK